MVTICCHIQLAYSKIKCNTKQKISHGTEFFEAPCVAESFIIYPLMIMWTFFYRFFVSFDKHFTWQAKNDNVRTYF